MLFRVQYVTVTRKNIIDQKTKPLSLGTHSLTKWEKHCYHTTRCVAKALANDENAYVALNMYLCRKPVAAYVLMLIVLLKKPCLLCTLKEACPQLILIGK